MFNAVGHRSFKSGHVSAAVNWVDRLGSRGGHNNKYPDLGEIVSMNYANICRTLYCVVGTYLRLHPGTAIPEQTTKKYVTNAVLPKLLVLKSVFSTCTELNSNVFQILSTKMGDEELNSDRVL